MSEVCKPSLGCSWQLTPAGWGQGLSEVSLVQTLMLLPGEHSATDQPGRTSGEAGWDRRPFPRAYNVISKWMCKMWGACQLTESHGWTFSVWREQAQWLSLCWAVLCGHMEPTLWSMPIAMHNYLVDTGNAILFSIFRAVSTAILLRGYFFMNIWHQNSFWGERWLYWKKKNLFGEYLEWGERCLHYIYVKKAILITNT